MARGKKKQDSAPSVELDADAAEVKFQEWKSAKTKSASGGQAAGVVLKTMENIYKIPRGAAALGFKLADMDSDTRSAFLRGFDKMREALDLQIEKDIVDLAEEKTPDDSAPVEMVH